MSAFPSEEGDLYCPDGQLGDDGIARLAATKASNSCYFGTTVAAQK